MAQLGQRPGAWPQTCAARFLRPFSFPVIWAAPKRRLRVVGRSYNHAAHNIQSLPVSALYQIPNFRVTSERFGPCFWFIAVFSSLPPLAIPTPLALGTPNPLPPSAASKRPGTWSRPSANPFPFICAGNLALCAPFPHPPIVARLFPERERVRTHTLFPLVLPTFSSIHTRSLPLLHSPPDTFVHFLSKDFVGKVRSLTVFEKQSASSSSTCRAVFSPFILQP